MTSKRRFCGSCGNLVDHDKTCSCKADKTDYKKYKRDYYKKNKESIKMLNSARWKKMRKYIINRDKGYCQRCYIKFNIINNKDLQVHHIKPRTEYPELMFDENNLITLCKLCNVQFGTTEVLDFDWNADDTEFNL